MIVLGISGRERHACSALVADNRLAAAAAEEAFVRTPEQDIKQSLERCRLDYVYEPDWPRLHNRISRMLSRGNLSAPGEPMACTPHDAIRSAFSCAVDALVMERFLVTKDYWLLRSDGD